MLSLVAVGHVGGALSLQGRTWEDNVVLHKVVGIDVHGTNVGPVEDELRAPVVRRHVAVARGTLE